jgi:hypothetical protein
MYKCTVIVSANIPYFGTLKGSRKITALPVAAELIERELNPRLLRCMRGGSPERESGPGDSGC